MEKERDDVLSLKTGKNAEVRTVLVIQMETGNGANSHALVPTNPDKFENVGFTPETHLPLYRFRIIVAVHTNPAKFEYVCFFYPFCLCVHTETYVNGVSESYKLENPIPLLLPSILNRRNESRRFQIYPLHRTFKICPFSVTKRQNGFEKTRFQFIQINRDCSPDNCISLNFSRILD